ncbi:MAG TPA: GDP-mannose 4,6-dehydratase [Acidimicrobiales bacterium]|nr:GDP-mannose 4,6-dehydratase [Acidimicrobiales bacterium]
MRILVTGSKGFVGHWLIAHLEESGDEAIGLDAEVDITEPAGLREVVVTAAPDAICHLAALSSVGASWGAGQATYQVNTVGTANLLDAALACRRRPRVLLISSSEVYGRVGPQDLPLGEDRAFAPVSPYAASKAAAELVGLQAWLGSGLEVVRARPFNHTGPGQRPDFVVPALAQQVAEARRGGADRLNTGNLEARRDISDVRDVVRAYRLLLQSGQAGQVYNVCRGEAVSIRHVAERLLALAGADIPIVVDPARVRPVEIPELRGDPSRLTAVTGWQPVIPLDTTLGDVLGFWLRQEG